MTYTRVQRQRAQAALRLTAGWHDPRTYVLWRDSRPESGRLRREAEIRRAVDEPLGTSLGQPGAPDDLTAREDRQQVIVGCDVYADALSAAASPRGVRIAPARDTPRSTT